MLREMQSVSSWIWTRVAVSISYVDNHYTMSTSRYTLVSCPWQHFLFGNGGLISLHLIPNVCKLNRKGTVLSGLDILLEAHDFSQRIASKTV